ncbi:hypothetical protein K438DRAFT_1765899 [Mycena galopus ATCC 62051]|nr:hypothetical protein K438DRAFT_1765899 [Mycena galopus ATCC 62051]
MEVFRKADWVSQGHKWQDIPPRVKRVCGYDFDVPEAIAARILPDDKISINGLLDFGLPRPVAALENPDAVFFTKNIPTIINESVILRVRHLDLPPVPVIRRLDVDGKQAWLDGFTRGLTPRTGSNSRYSRGNDQMIGNWRPKPAVSWELSPGKLQNEGSPMHTLWRYLGPTWLSDTDENDMLERLRAKIVDDADLVRTIRVEAVKLLNKLRTAFAKRDQEDYQQSPSTRWLRSFGEDVFGRGERLITIAHLGDHNKMKHWVSIELHGGKRELRYADSLGSVIPRSLRDIYEWWTNKHTKILVEFGSLPIAIQSDGHSCGMLALNAVEHAVFPDFPLMNQADVVHERLVVFNRIVNGVLDRIADEEEDTMSDVDSGTAPSDLPAEAIPFGPPPRSFAKLARSVSFTFEVPEPVFEGSALDEPKNLKRARLHPDAPTPNASPEKKRPPRAEHECTPPPPFNLVSDPSPPSSSPRADTTNDVFGSPIATEKSNPVQSNLKNFFKVATPEEKALERAQEAEKRKEGREERVARERQEKFLAQLKRTEDARDRKRKSRGKLREERIANGWEPALAGRKRKSIEPEKLDETYSKSTKVAESSRPRRQFKEDAKKNNKPCGRKPNPENEQTDTKLTNYVNPLIWAQIETAALKASGTKWSQAEICRAAKHLAPTTFAKLTPQVVGRWIDKEAAKKGINKWTDSVLKRVERGSAPGGHSTRAGILDSYPELVSKIRRHLEALHAIGTVLSLVTIRAIMVAFIQRDQPHIFSRVAIDGSQFRCFDSFVKKFLCNTIGWSQRAATRAAQKIPANHAEILHAAFLRRAILIRDYAIPAALPLHYVPGSTPSSSADFALKPAILKLDTGIAWERCEAGRFNLSQASLTSSEALAALRDLPNTNPALHQELTAPRVMPGDTEIEELLFPQDNEVLHDDESDIPLEVLINHVETGNSSKLPDGFVVDEAGNLARDGVVEDTELNVVADALPLAVRRGKRSTKAPNPFGGKDMWEE